MLAAMSEVQAIRILPATAFSKSEINVHLGLCLVQLQADRGMPSFFQAIFLYSHYYYYSYYYYYYYSLFNCLIDVINVGGEKKVVVQFPGCAANHPIRYYLKSSEIFDALHKIHLDLGHSGRDRIDKMAVSQYTNLTR